MAILKQFGNNGSNTSNGTTTPILSSAYSSNGETETTTPTSNGSSYDDDLAQLEREGNYKTYFSKLVQNANINKLASKYLDNSLKQQGINTQGAGSIAGTQLSNAYLNANATALSDYNTQENSITENAYNRYQQAEEEATEDSASKVSTYEGNMQTAYSNGNLEDWYANNVTNNTSLTDSEKAELQRYYEAIGSSGNSLLTSAEKTYGMLSADTLTSGSTTTDSKTKDEINSMIFLVTTNPPSTTTLYHLVSAGNGVDQYIAYDPSTKAYYRVSADKAKGYKGTTYTIGRTAGQVESGDTFTSGNVKSGNKFSESDATGLGFPSNAKSGTTYIYNGTEYVFVSNGVQSFWVKK